MADGDGTTDFNQNNTSYTGGTPNFDERTGTYTNPNGGGAMPNLGPQGQNNGFLANVSDTLNRGLSSPYLIPAMGMAAQQFQQAGKYTDLGNQAAARADPFGNNGNRQQYIDQLSAL